MSRYRLGVPTVFFDVETRFGEIETINFGHSVAASTPLPISYDKNADRKPLLDPGPPLPVHIKCNLCNWYDECQWWCTLREKANKLSSSTDTVGKVVGDANNSNPYRRRRL